MVQPYNYMLNLPNPVESVMQGVMMGQQMRQQQQAQQRQLRLQQAIMNLRENPTSQNFADFYLEFPEMSEQMEKYRATLGEADKGTLTGAAREATLAINSGKTAEVPAIFERYALAAENAGRADLAKQMRDAGEYTKKFPDAAPMAVKMFYQGVDPDGFKAIEGADASTTFQKDFAFIRDTFGPEAATEYAQFGRGGIVSIPIGNGQTYVGPPSLAPGAGRWQQQQPQAGMAGVQQQPQRVDAASGGDILQRSSQSKTIRAEEAQIIKQSLGPNGQKAFDKWRADNNIKVIVRTGTAPDGRRVVQYDDGKVAYAAD